MFHTALTFRRKSYSPSRSRRVRGYIFVITNANVILICRQRKGEGYNDKKGAGNGASVCLWFTADLCQDLLEE
ncbi:hypothetical protein AGOR_G00041860 [Albula goreensis]|uniref:Uncharacterized protein n=1 Tax=Albula goreensis TaxID=1534307 RepID=A0A8T3DYY9_9TELE|nr:hypothetical protein AGOR_G00041860 [Albula goreensis]